MLDDPHKVADLKQKVLNFLNAPNENKSSLKILDVEYAIVCAEEGVVGSLQALSPPAFQLNSQFNKTADEKLRITVVFNKAVDTTTLIPQHNLILDTERDHNASVTLGWDPTNTRAIITTVKNHTALCNYDPDCFFRLTLDGTSPEAISAEDGSLLNEGNRDYWTGFTIVG